MMKMSDVGPTSCEIVIQLEELDQEEPKVSVEKRYKPRRTTKINTIPIIRSDISSIIGKTVHSQRFAEQNRAFQEMFKPDWNPNDYKSFVPTPVPAELAEKGVTQERWELLTDPIRYRQHIIENSINFKRQNKL
jgi:hypothetical protein